MRENKTYQKLLLIMLGIVLTATAMAKVQVIKPHQGAIQRSFTELAKTRLERTYIINMPISGKLKRINLQPGDMVTKGQPLAQLEQKPLIQKVRGAKSMQDTFKEWYDLRVKILHRQEVLKKHGFVTQEQLDQSRAYVKMLWEQIQKSQSDSVIAKYNLKQSVVYAPITGTVLNRYQEGDTWLPEGAKLLKLGDINDLEVVCDVLTQDAQLLHIGDPVLLTSIGSPITLQGKVKRVDPAGFTKRSSLGVEEQRVNVIINIKDPGSANLGVGYRLQAKFLVGAQQKNALVVPRFSVLQDPQGRYYVFTVQKKKLHKQIVQIGIKTDNEISITKSLTTKDNIVAQPTADMKNGTKI